MFDNRIYNVLSANLTVNDIIENIKKHISDVKIDLVDKEIMNQLSYEVSNKRFSDKGFKSCGNMQESIEQTINLLKNAGGKIG